MNKVLIDFDSSIYAISSACDGVKWSYKGQEWDTKAVATKALEAEGKDVQLLERIVHPEPWDKVQRTIDQYVNNMFEDLNNPFNYLILTSGGSGNFRYEVATIVPYKGNRVAELPYHFNAVKEYVTQKLDVKKVNPYWEVDDAVGILYKEGDLIVSPDKDLDQLPGDHFNPNKKQYHDISEIVGLQNFYCQCLTGDTSDNIPGIYGIGKTSSYLKQIKECETEKEMFNIVFNIYKSRFGSYSMQFMLENCRLLWLCRNHKDVPLPFWMGALLAPTCFYTDESVLEYILL